MEISEPLANVIVALLGILGTILTGVISWAKTTEVYERARKHNAAFLFDAAAAGVMQTYESYSRAIKAKADDGKLTEAERIEARRRAMETARNYLASEAPALGRRISDEILADWIQRAFNALRAENGIPQKTETERLKLAARKYAE